MAYDEKLAERIRVYLAGRKDVAEKNMMGGLTVMVDDKMCVGVIKDDLMVRFDPARQDELLRKPGARVMDITKRVSKGYILVNPSGTKDEKSFAFWLDTALAFNKIAKSSKKPKTK